MKKNEKELLIKSIIRYNYNEDDYGFKKIYIIRDTGFLTLEKNEAICAVPKNIIDAVEYVTLDFQCISFKFFDKEDKLVFESITDLYDDLGTPTAFVEYDECV